ncbi:hypothetical protein [Sporomusa acidovorans]|uniref:Porin domain-containing protein n=1 Tax=Sporomusa acidovorans (strain ATCC 49682 / DSM 3132 / Mol) TaxID=1123286 RepID=A0ABZ3JAV4_SPOA4|nr:hypothetical protein [Sporomusa acidovorans]OZC21697.1 hypothetical protein SPACI_17720 [Sporomusa acidovorans DSM 3132]SDD59818.1 hypothetical protein SAMN04488499_1002161 [Sporomusa acidovorans]
MNKKIFVKAMIGTYLMTTTGLASAAPIGDTVSISGDYQVEGRVIHDRINTNDPTQPKYNSSFFHQTVRVNITAKIDDDTTFFTRFSNDKNTGSNARSYEDGTSEFDWYGVKGKFNNWKYSLGRQAVTLGKGAIINTGYSANGIQLMFDGAILSRPIGTANIQVIGGKTTGPATNYNYPSKEWYGFDVTNQFSDTIQGGVAFANCTTDQRRYYALNANVKLSPRFNLSGEFVRSSADTLNQGYFVAGTYALNQDTNFTVQYNHVERNSADTIVSGISAWGYPFYGNGLISGDSYSGLTYAYGKALNKNLSFHAVYLDLKSKGFSGRDREFATGLTWSF